MPVLERKIAHKMTTLCSHITYSEFVLPLPVSFVSFEPSRLRPYFRASFKEPVWNNFKKSTDKSIFQVLAEIRIEYACKLLANSDLTITEVAFSSGYNTPTLFFEQFQKIIRLTPAEYRREINGTAK